MPCLACLLRSDFVSKIFMDLMELWDVKSRGPMIFLNSFHSQLYLWIKLWLGFGVMMYVSLQSDLANKSWIDIRTRYFTILNSCIKQQCLYEFSEANILCLWNSGFVDSLLWNSCFISSVGEEIRWILGLEQKSNKSNISTIIESSSPEVWL